MEIGIIGLPQSGKTTLFNALTHGKAATRPFGTPEAGPNIGTVKVPDARLQGLQAILNPKSVVSAEIKYVDVAAQREKVPGPYGAVRSYLTRTDGLINVVRCFKDESIPVKDGVDPWRDILAMDQELILSDLAIIERRLERINESLKGARPPERENLIKEQSLVMRIKSSLENGIPIREQGLSDDEGKVVEGYQLLSNKPVILVLNIGEDQLLQAPSLEGMTKERFPRSNVAAICAKLEMELAQLDEAEASEFRSAMGIGEGARDRIIKLSYELLGMVSFFSIASGEVRAWAVKRDTPASRAARSIHSDMERGFIRAEVIAYNDLIRCGSIAQAKKHGLLRLEGKNYLVQDGDVITFLFSV